MINIPFKNSIKVIEPFYTFIHNTYKDSGHLEGFLNANDYENAFNSYRFELLSYNKKTIYCIFIRIWLNYD